VLGAGRGYYRVGAPQASRMGEAAFGSVLFGAIILHSAPFSTALTKRHCSICASFKEQIRLPDAGVTGLTGASFGSPISSNKDR
jgi:hypothetical protein